MKLFRFGIALWLLSATVAYAAADETAGIYHVKKSSVQSGVIVGGSVISKTAVTLSAQAPGRVESIAGAEGDYFETGSALLALDDDDLLAQRRSALAELGNANTALRNANVQYSREIVSPQSRSSPGGMGMPSMMDQMFTNPMSSMMGNREPAAERHADIYARGAKIEQSRGAIEQAKSKIEEIDARLRDTRSVAPFAGVITRKYIEVGDTVQPGQALLDFADTRSLQILANIPARFVSGLSEGSELVARLDQKQRGIPVTIAKIFPTADDVRHTIRIKFDLPPDSGARAGMYAEVVIPDRSSVGHDLMVIPNSSIVWKGGLPMVFVVNGENLTSLRLIRVGDDVGKDATNILSGLNEGDAVVVQPTPGMVSGTPFN